MVALAKQQREGGRIDFSGDHNDNNNGDDAKIAVIPHGDIIPGMAIPASQKRGNSDVSVAYHIYMYISVYAVMVRI
jgi:hypothetical protein